MNFLLPLPRPGNFSKGKKPLEIQFCTVQLLTYVYSALGFVVAYSSEYNAVKKIHEMMNTPGTISCGYNTMGFDDEFLRFSFYRNLLPPYTHQYAKNCSRMDLLPITVTFRLYKPDIIHWPTHQNKTTLKLEYINESNQLAKGQAHDSWMSLLGKLNKDLEHIMHLSNINGVREAFRTVSNKLIELEKNFGHAADKKHFVAFCPMAFDNKGGSWLQTQKDIHNPYYGAAMLKCGEIKEEIAAIK